MFFSIPAHLRPQLNHLKRKGAVENPRHRKYTKVILCQTTSVSVNLPGASGVIGSSLLGQVLRPAVPRSVPTPPRALAVLKRLINKLKKAYPGALILFRADAGFAVPALYLEEQPQTRYGIGFIANN